MNLGNYWKILAQIWQGCSETTDHKGNMDIWAMGLWGMIRRHFSKCSSQPTSLSWLCQLYKLRNPQNIAEMNFFQLSWWRSEQNYRNNRTFLLVDCGANNLCILNMSFFTNSTKSLSNTLMYQVVWSLSKFINGI